MAGLRRHRINSANEEAGAKIASTARRRRRPRAWRFLVLGACSLVLLGLGLAAGLTLAGEENARAPEADDKEVRELVLNPLVTMDPPPEGEVLISGDDASRRAQVKLESMPPAGRAVYELWLLDGTRGQLSLGSFTVSASGEAEMEVPVPVEPSAFTYLDVSREPPDGNPGHSGVSIMRAPTAPAS